MKAKVLCVAPVITDPGNARTIQIIKRAGFQVETAAFETSHYPGRLPDCPIQSLGGLRFRPWYFRLPELMTHIPRIRAAIRRSDIVYVFQLDMLVPVLPAAAGLGKPVVLEIRDISPHQVARGLKGRLVRWMDRLATEACRLLVLTSDGYHAYYRDRLDIKTASLVLENKIDALFAAVAQKQENPILKGKPLDDRPLRIGYFGFLRDDWSLCVLEKLVAAAPDRFEVVLAGAFHHHRMNSGDFLQRIKQNPNLHYKGPYRRAEDLPGLCADVDMVMACTLPVVPFRWSRTFRYYDACFFQKPLIVRAGTGDAGEVARHQTGLVITAEDAEEAAAAINRLTSADWERWRRNMAGLPDHIYAYTDQDAMRVAQALEKAASRNARG